MGWRFRNSIRLMPGVRFNISKSGISTSLGPRGATINLGKQGARATVGLPGSGISHSQMLTSSAGGGLDAPSSRTKKSGCLPIAGVLGFLLIVGRCISPNETTSTLQPIAPLPAAVTPALGSTNSVDSADTVYISTASLNGRAKPTTSSTVVHKLKRGESVRIVERKNGWLKVIQGAATFWIITKHVSSSPPEAQYTPAPIARLVSSPKKSSKRHSSLSSGGGCRCSSGGVCVGPRGGRYCYTSSGNKRYGI